MTKNNLMVRTLFLNNTPIKEVDSIKYLCITFTNSLPWKNHISDIITGANKKFRTFVK